jgi:germination protein M
MKANKWILIVMIAVLLVLMAGCGWVENIKLFKGGDDSQDGATEDQTSAVLEQGLDVDSAAPPSTSYDSGALTSAPAPEAGTSSGETRKVVLYFASADGSALVPETREITKEEGIARATVNHLISGPASSDLLPTLPAATILDDINISNGLCTVDFSSELLDDLSGDHQSQLMAVYSIVNTLTQFDTVDYVQILVDGKVVDASFGGVDVSTALAPASNF